MAEIKSPGKDWRTILTLLISALGILYFIVQAFALGVFWLKSILDPSVSTQQGISIGLLLWISVLGGCLLIPLLLLSIYRLRGDPVPLWLDAQRPDFNKKLYWVILVWPVVVALGWLVASNKSLAVFLLGPINVLVAGLPVLWIFHVARRGLSGGSHMRQWRIFAFSITLLPMTIILVELLAIAFIGGAGWLWMSFRFMTDPKLERDITYLINQVMIFGEDLDGLIQFLEPYILQPGVVYWALAVFGGILPIIEEVLKPLALWGLVRRKLTQQEGFVGGMLCGAGFALMENIFYFTNVLLAEDWLFMAVGRAGTGVLHILASGLVGWGLARAWQEGKWPFLALLTLGAFVLHGLWNGFALVSGVAPFVVLGTEPTLGQMLLYYSPLFLLLLISIISLLLINRHLRPKVSSGERLIVKRSSEGSF
jgi:hypothetical protein